MHSGVKPHTDQRLQGLPPLSPLEIFDRHSVHPPLSPSQISPDQLHQQQIFSPAKPSVLQHHTAETIMDRERHNTASTDRESEIRRIFETGLYYKKLPEAQKMYIKILQRDCFNTKCLYHMLYFIRFFGYLCSK